MGVARLARRLTRKSAPRAVASGDWGEWEDGITPTQAFEQGRFGRPTGFNARIYRTHMNRVYSVQVALHVDPQEKERIAAKLRRITLPPPTPLNDAIEAARPKPEVVPHMFRYDKATRRTFCLRCWAGKKEAAPSCDGTLDPRIAAVWG